MRFSVSPFLPFAMVVVMSPGRVQAQSDPALPLIKVVETKGKDAKLEAMKKLGQLGRAAEAAIPALGFELRSGDEQLSARAALTLAQIGKASVPELINALRDFRPLLRLRALNAITLMGPQAKEAIPVMLGFLRDDNPAIRAQAALILGEIGLGEKSVVKALGELLVDSHPAPRQNAIQALVRFGKNAVPGLKELLNADRQTVRVETARLLGRFGRDARESTADLIAALGDPANEMRVAAAEGLAGIGGEALEALPALLRGLKEEKDFAVQQSLYQALTRIGNQNVPNLLDEFRKINDEGGWAAPFVLAQFGPRTRDAIKPLALMLSEKDSNIRLAATVALGQMGQEAVEALPILTKTAFNDTVPAVRGSAAQSLMVIDPRQQKMVSKQFKGQLGEVHQQLLNLETKLRKIDVLMAEPIVHRRPHHALMTNPEIQENLDKVVSFHVFSAAMKNNQDARVFREKTKEVISNFGPEGVPALVRGLNLAGQLGLGFC